MCEQGGQSHAKGKKEVGGEEPPNCLPYSLSYIDGSLYLYFPFEN